MNFDQLVNRRGTHSVHWDEPHVDEDVVCAGVADMDFQAPAAVREVLADRVAHGVFGYSITSDEDWQAIIDWMRDVHDFPVEREWLLYSPGVVPTLHAAVRAVSQPGDRVVIETPAYPPFFGAIRGEERQLVENPMKFVDGCWQRDWEGLEACFKDGVKVFLLCSPHNPTGRVWTRQEQERLVGLCIKYDVTVICDEIHSDIIMPGHVHTSIAALPGMGDRTVTAIAPTKTFNLAGLQISSVICAREDWRKAIGQMLYTCGHGNPNVLAQLAQTAAYQKGRPWLEAMIAYVDQNARKIVQALNACNLPTAKPEGTYLVWVDGRRLGLAGNELTNHLVEKARLYVQTGDVFGAPGYFRINLATSHANVDRMIEGIRRL